MTLHNKQTHDGGSLLMQFTLTSAAVQSHTAGLLRDGLRLKDYGKSCPTSTLLAVLFTACSRLTSLFAACNHLRRAPSHETVRKALHANLPALDSLERRLNRTLGHTISRPLRRCLRRRRQRVAIDLHLRPYHGQPAASPDELVRGQPKSGTTHFHAYATAYLVLQGQRFTLALTYVRDGEKMPVVLKRLLRLCARGGVRPALLLLHRGFWSVGVIRYLQAARCPFLMPVVTRGKKAGKPGGPSGTRVFQGWEKGGFDEYTLKETGKKGKKARVGICVHVRNRMGRRGKTGRERLVYAYWGWQPRRPLAVSDLYRLRFGIETSYRQLGEAKAKTCTRSPQVRLFLVAVALLLRNVWVWLHHEVLSSPRRGRREYNLGRLRFKTLLAFLQREAERAFGVVDHVLTERDVPIGFTSTRQRSAA
jgi:putative transposase